MNGNLGTCRLCNCKTQLCDSHIVPHFVFDWLKRTSATGRLRLAFEPNLLQQDGIKMKLLCEICESHFGQWEKIFAEKIFLPIHEDTESQLHYDKWLRLFILSVAWRILVLHLAKASLKSFPRNHKRAIQSAFEGWKSFLRASEIPSSVSFHVLPMAKIVRTTDDDVPGNMNRYILRSIDTDVVYGPKDLFIYAKLCRIVLLTFLRIKNSDEWEGTRIYERGVIKVGQSYAVPGHFAEYLKDKARKVRAICARLSERQKGKSSQALISNLDRFRKSETMSAMNQDVFLFGDSAFDNDDSESG